MTHQLILQNLSQGFSYAIKPEYEDIYPNIKIIYVDKDSNNLIYEDFQQQRFWLNELTCNLLEHIELAPNQDSQGRLAAENTEPQSGDEVWIAEQFARKLRYNRENKKHQMYFKNRLIHKSKLRAEQFTC